MLGLVSSPAQPGIAWGGGEGFLQRCLSAVKACGLGTSDSYKVFLTFGVLGAGVSVWMWVGGNGLTLFWSAGGKTIYVASDVS